MRNAKNVLMVFLFLLTQSEVLKGQEYAGGTVQSSQMAFTKWFDEQSSDSNSRLYNGATYPLQIISRFGHQFFESRQWQSGTICLGDQWYFDVPLLLDLQSEQLVTRHPNIGITNGVVLDKKLITYFKIGSKPFISLEYEGEKHFFEVLLEGKNFDLLATHQKLLRLKSDGYHIEEIIKYLVLHDRNIVALHSKKSLEEITPDALSIAKQIKSRESKFNLRKEDLLVEFVRRFDERVR